jgi:hypothetical protein
MWLHLKNSPELQPNRITNDEDNYKSSIEKAGPKPLLIEKKSCEHILHPPILPNRYKRLAKS